MRKSSCIYMEGSEPDGLVSKPFMVNIVKPRVNGAGDPIMDFC